MKCIPWMCMGICQIINVNILHCCSAFKEKQSMKVCQSSGPYTVCKPLWPTVTFCSEHYFTDCQIQQWLKGFMFKTVVDWTYYISPDEVTDAQINQATPVFTWTCPTVLVSWNIKDKIAIPEGIVFFKALSVCIPARRQGSGSI